MGMEVVEFVRGRVHEVESEGCWRETSWVWNQGGSPCWCHCILDCRVEDTDPEAKDHVLRETGPSKLHDCGC
jgi:hypothetical protein